MRSPTCCPGPCCSGSPSIGSLTAILSHVGLRSLFPILVPEPLWERVNAVDSNGYVIATIVGPPLAAALVALLGGPIALLVIGVAFGIAAAVLIGVPDPVAAQVASTGRVLTDAWQGLRYTWRNPTLRGLGFAITFANLAHGMTTIVLPLIVIERFGLSEAVVGVVFAASGISGVASAAFFGRVDSRGREWAMLVWPMVGLVPVVGLLLIAAGQASVPVGVALLVLEMLGVGLLLGPCRHRAVHGPPATDRSGMDRPGVRGVDGVQLPRHAGRRRAGRHPRRPKPGACDRRARHRRTGAGGPGHRLLVPRLDPAATDRRRGSRGRVTRRSATAAA